MINITKEKIISLIKEYAKDETVIGDYKLDFENHGFYISSFKFNLNVFSMKSFFVHYAYKYKFISNSFFYSFNKIDETTFKEKNIYFLKVKFDELPDITILNKTRTSSTTKQKIKGKILKFIPIDIDVKIVEDIYGYTLKCGHHEFDISADEVKDIFDFIVEENRIFTEKNSDIEISKRLEKYNIK